MNSLSSDNSPNTAFNLVNKFYLQHQSTLKYESDPKGVLISVKKNKQKNICKQIKKDMFIYVPPELFASFFHCSHTQSPNSVSFVRRIL